ncbi:MAG TPA: PilZ domain-containing protein [bacterium]|jgi:hypothetical protein|nr:PilZ domain-containing protein [bacterium]
MSGDDGQDLSGMEKIAKEALDKRRFERLKAGLQVKYRPVGPTEEATLTKQGDYAAPESFQAQTSEVEDFKRVTCEDISLGGLKINTPFPVPEGTRLWLQISLPGIPIAVNAIGQVRWSRRAGSLCSSGIQFHGISMADLAKVERFLALQKPPKT